ncbi:MAG: pilin [Pseudomonadota bacterium]
MSTDAPSGSIYNAPESDTSTSGSDDLFAAWVGPKRAEYYKARFEKIASGGGNVGWHWPAFFFSSAWLLYRKMWLYALLYIIVIPIAGALVLGVASVLVDPVTATTGYYVIYFIYAFILMPMFANRLYYGHVKAKVDKVSSMNLSDGQMAEELARKGGTSWLAYLFVIIPVFGILAAIAIPAYQDYTIRAQISEGLSLAGPAKAAVGEYYERNGAMPSDNAEAGMDDPVAYRGPYVEGVTVESGDIVILYGRDANSNLVGESIVLFLETDSGQRPEWQCYSETLPDNWLPLACR